MKKILLLLSIYVSMGFTARKNNTSAAVAEPVHQKIVQAGGYFETTSPEAYTITLQ